MATIVIKRVEKRLLRSRFMVFVVWLGSKDGDAGKGSVSDMVVRTGTLVAFVGNAAIQGFRLPDATGLPGKATTFL